MADLLSGASTGGGQAALGLGLADYLSKAQSNKNARAQQATNDKWGPLLSLWTHGGGAPTVPIPKASFASVMGPAATAAINSAPIPGVPGVGGVNAGGVSSQLPLAGGQGENMGGMTSMNAAGGMMVPARPFMGRPPMRPGMGMHPMGMPGAMRPTMAPRMMAGGGYAGGGDMGGSAYAGGGCSPWKMMAGGQVPGRAPMPGNNPMNDTQTTQTSPGEVILPRDVSKEGLKGHSWKVAAYLNEVKKHGPGPMPVKPYANTQDKPQSGSMSPWKAMAGGGKLDAASRNALPSSDFAEPEKRKYPLENKSHAANAKARVSQFGTPSEKKRVNAAVARKYPGMGQ